MSNEIDKKSLDRAVSMLSGMLGAEERKNMEKMVGDPQTVKKLSSMLSDKDMAKVSEVLNNPQMLQKILQNPKNADAVKKFLGGGK